MCIIRIFVLRNFILLHPQSVQSGFSCNFTCYILQCNHSIPSHLMTAHIITHYSSESLSDVRRNLHKFISGHMQWIQCVRAEILAKKKIKIEDYCKDLSEMVTLIDQLGLLIIARMYHQHFGVFLKDGVWSTRRDNSLENCTIYFAYNGGSAFCDTVDAPEEFLQEQLDVQLDTNVEVLDEHPLNLSAPPVAKRISPPPIIRPSSSSSLSSSDSDDEPAKSPLPNQPAVHGGSESLLLPK